MFVCSKKTGEVWANVQASYKVDVQRGRHGGSCSADPASLLMEEIYLASTRIPRPRDQLAEMVIDFRRGAGRLDDRARLHR
jgi:hypothetical protein